MPSPFHGMDPYLEGSLWSRVHFLLGAEFVRQLAPRLRPRYLVLLAERFVMETPEGVAITVADIYLDVGVAERGPAPLSEKTGTVALRTAFCLLKQSQAATSN